jgi:hypothetical protein
MNSTVILSSPSPLSPSTSKTLNLSQGSCKITYTIHPPTSSAGSDTAVIMLSNPTHTYPPTKRGQGNRWAELVNLDHLGHIGPSAVAQVRAQVRSCGICGGQSGTGAGFLRALRFPLLILIPPTAPYSSDIVRGWDNSPVSGRRTKWTQSHLTPRK